MTGCSAVFLKQANPADNHVSLVSLAHIIYGQTGNGSRREGFHLNTRLPRATTKRLNRNAVLFKQKRNIYSGELKRMAHGNDI